MWISTPGTGRPASETAIIVAKAIGTEKTAGWASTVSLASLPATSAATIAPVAVSGAERVVHGRPCLRGGGKRQLPGAAARPHLRRFNTTGAILGVVFGVVSSIALIIVSPKVWPGADSEGSPIGWTLANPGIVSIPLGFLGCWLGTMLTTERGAARTFSELHVRSETGLGAERAAVS
jgi:cation/acetate symporter